MPVTTSSEAVEQKCAACGAGRTVPVSGLQLGNVRHPYVIRLPPCPCGAVEHLMVTHDACPEPYWGSDFDRQRRAVNALALHLKAAGRVHPDQVAFHAADARAVQDLPAAGVSQA